MFIPTTYISGWICDPHCYLPDASEMINIFVSNEKECNNYAENAGRYRTNMVVRDVCTTALKPFVILESVLNLDNTVGKYIPRN
jgi:hypothetical protein